MKKRIPCTKPEQSILACWSELAGNADLNFSTEPAEILGDLAVAPWILRWGNHEDDGGCGVNLIRVRDGRIIHVRGYVKA